MMRSWLEYPRTKFDHLLFDLVPPEHQWRVSLSLAIGVHLLLVVTALISTYILNYRSRLPEVYTVNLFSVEDIRTPHVAGPAKTVVEPRRIKKKLKAASKAVPRPVPVKPSPRKALSTRPIRVKTKDDVEKLKQLAESIRAEKIARETEKEAREKAREAVEALRQSLRAAGEAEEVGRQKAAPASGASSRGGVVVDEITKRYLIAVNNQIQAHWKLPDLQSWKSDLEAVLVIRVRRDGIVAESFFEKKAANVYFNQFVEKTIQESSPLPPFPTGLNQQEMEIGLRFRPGEVL